VFADGRTTVSIAASAFSGHAGNALHVRGGASTTVAGTTFTGDGRVEAADLDGFDAVRVGDDARVSFEDVVWRDHPRFALSLFGRAEVASRGGRFEANGGVYEDLGMYYSAILVEDEASLALAGDVLDGNTGGAIEAIGSSTVVADGVTVARTGTFANVYVGGTASVRFLDGDVFENEGAMFVTEEGSLTIRGGRVRDGAGIGVQAVGRSRLSVEGAEVTDHLEYGIAVMEDATGVVRDAFLAGNRSGIVAFDRSRLRAERNVVASNVRTGIGFLDASRGEAIGNRVGANGLNGIVVGDDGDARIVDNVVEGNVERGVFFAERATGHASGNTIRGSAVGLAVAPTAAPEVGANRFEDNGEDRAAVE
jgi:nitrous oxidase accessory protein NosD